jgi:ABC-2 type transport system permease protein
LSADLRAVLWKEWKELVAQRGRSPAAALSQLAVLGFLGLVFPVQQGAGWIESPLPIILAAWMPLLLVASIVCDSVAGERERHTLETLLASRLSHRAVLWGKVAAAVVYGWGFTLLTLALGIAAINVFHPAGGVQAPRTALLLAMTALSLLTSILASAAGVVVSLGASSVRQAQQVASAGAMAIYLIPLMVWKSLSEQARAVALEFVLSSSTSSSVALACVGLIILDIAVVGMAMMRFGRTHLLLE